MLSPADSLLAALARRETLFVNVVNAPAHRGSGMWETLGAVVVGVTIFVATQAIAKLVIDPALELRRVIGRIAHALVFYANVHANPGDLTKETMDEAQKVYRDLSSELRVAAASVPPWGLWVLSRLRIVPGLRQITVAATRLIRLSNMIHRADLPGINVPLLNVKTADEIRSSLGIPSFD